MMHTRTPWIGLVLLAACFGNPDTLGLPCVEDLACFDGLVCSEAGVCVEPTLSSSTTNGDGEPGDGDTGDGEGESGDHEGSTGDGDTGDGDGESGDGDGDTTGDGDGETGDGDGDTDTGVPQCGDGVREGNENCDGMDLDGMSCADFDFGGGMLACDGECNFDMTDCCLSTGQSCQLGDNCCVGTCLNLNLMFKCG